MIGTISATAPQDEASDTLRSAWVSANAGSGKTFALVNRVIKLLLGGAVPSRILCLTFTKAAAAEMSQNLLDILGLWVSLGDTDLKAAIQNIGILTVDRNLLLAARRLFTRAIETPGGLKIQTIHSLCERLLHQFPVEAGVVPGFKVLDDRTAKEYLIAARSRTLRASQLEPGSKLSEAFHDIARLASARELDEILTEGLTNRSDLFASVIDDEAIGKVVIQLRASLNIAADENEQTVVEPLVLDRDEWASLVLALRNGSKGDVERSQQLSNVTGAGDTLRNVQNLLLTGESEPRDIGRIASKKVRVAEPWVEPFIRHEQNRFLQALIKRSDTMHLAATKALLEIFRTLHAEYEHLKQKGGVCDYDDLILKTRAMLVSRPEAAWILYKLDGGLDHILVDEAQDTNPMQWDIILSLISEFFAGEGSRSQLNRTVFVVGDRKQSIFSFQGADTEVFDDVRSMVAGLVRGGGQKFSDLDFTVSYRSTSEVLWAVDSVFKSGQAACGGVTGMPSKPLIHQSSRRGEKGLVEIWPLIAGIETEERDPWTALVDGTSTLSPRRALARHIARKVQSWIGRRQIGALNRAVEPADIMILVRRRNDLFDAIIQELRNLDVPVTGSDRLDLTSSIAVKDVLALVRFCILPEDDYSLACVLKSPLIPQRVDENQLFDIAWNRESRSLYDCLKSSDDPDFASVRELLSFWMDCARKAGPFEFISAVLLTSRKRFLERLGQETGDALDAMLDQSLEFERSHSASLSRFVEWFSVGGVEVRRSMEQASGKVRILTVHGAKGLEAPIVILPDTTDVPNRRQQPNLMMVSNAVGKLPFWRLPGTLMSEQVSAWVAEADLRQAHEYQRLLYVAMTRARDELYICGCEGGREIEPGSWFMMASTALVPGMAKIQNDEGWRFGDEPGWCEPAPVEELPVPNILPLWLTTKVACISEPDATEPLTTNPPAVGSTQFTRGSLLHKILCYLPDLDPGKREEAARKAVARAGFGDELADEILGLFADPLLDKYLSSGAMTEVPIIYTSGQKRTVVARIDRLIVDDTGVLVLDYKSDNPWPKIHQDVGAEYLLQLAGYREALRGIYPNKPMQFALLWTAAPMLMKIPDEVIPMASLD